MYCCSLIICFLLYFNTGFCFYENGTSWGRPSGSDHISSGEKQDVYRARVAGGTLALALIEAYPYNVFIERQHRGTVCGGAILAPRHVISAGQCYEDVLTVYVGSDRKFMGKRIKAQKVTRHPEYTEHSNADGSTRVSNNLMMVELSEVLTPYGPSVQPIVLGNLLIDYQDPSSLATLTGYGNTESATIVNKAGDTYQKVDGENIRLHKVSMAISSTESPCVRHIEESGLQCSFCAESADGKSAGGCVGDTGSPLVVHNKLIGVLSRGVDETKCEGGAHIYAKVPCATLWIWSVMDASGKNEE